MTSCPHTACNASLSSDAVFDMRVLGLAVECPSCRAHISTDTFRLAQFLRDVPSVATRTHYVTNDIPMPHLPRDGTKDSYMKLMSRTVYNYETLTHHPFPKSERMQLDARFAAYFEPLDLIHAMACHVQFMAPMCAHLSYWTEPTVLAASVVRYNQFLHCVRHASSPLMPTTDIALVRVVHQSLDGTLPFFDLPSTPDALKLAYADTFLAWSDFFNEAYSSYVPDYATWMTAKAKNPIQRASLKKKWTKLMRVPSWNCRFVGVDETYVHDSVPQATAVEVAEDDIQHTVSDASVAVAQGFVAVIGTPMTDDRARLPTQVAALLKPAKGRAGLAYTSGNKVIDAIDRALNTGYTGY